MMRGALSVPGVLALAVLAMLAGCKDTTTVPVELVSADDRINGTLSLSGQRFLRAGNPVGPLIISGEAPDSTIRYYANRVAAAPTIEEATAALAAIAIAGTTVGDSLVVGVETPPSSGNVTYGCLLSLGVPFRLPLLVSGVSEDVTIEDRFGDVTVQDARAVTLLRHMASADISIAGGALTLEAEPPDSGHVRAMTDSGDIELRIPTTASATLTLRASGGSITVTGLTLGNVVESSGALSGTLGGGAAAVVLETKKGNIILKGI